MTRTALALTAVLAFASLVGAAEPPPKPAGGIDLDGITKLLDATTLKTKPDGKVLRVYLPGDEEWFVEVWPSQVAPVVILTFPCQVASEGSIPAEPVLRMMAQNGLMAGAYFGFNDKTRQFYLESTVPTEGLTTKKLKAELDRLQKLAVKTGDLWVVSKWTTPEKK